MYSDIQQPSFYQGWGYAQVQIPRPPNNHQQQGQTAAHAQLLALQQQQKQHELHQQAQQAAFALQAQKKQALLAQKQAAVAAHAQEIAAHVQASAAYSHQVNYSQYGQFSQLNRSLRAPGAYADALIFATLNRGQCQH
ncbi:hypothetical protein DFH27DRAFT_524439 [Peziza echinospora]|nr:hypothetical protein DFH27DRAFT_524439 [Peziza echinospora]